MDLPATRYYDEPYGKGLHCVILHIGDDLARQASQSVARVQVRRSGISFWAIYCRSPEDCEAVQACRFPQYRFLVNGAETHQHTGVLDDEDLIAIVDGLET